MLLHRNEMQVNPSTMLKRRMSHLPLMMEDAQWTVEGTFQLASHLLDSGAFTDVSLSADESKYDAGTDEPLTICDRKRMRAGRKESLDI